MWQETAVHMPTEVRCIECDQRAVGPAAGWMAYFGGGHDDEPLQVRIYCPACAHRELGMGNAA